MRLPIRLLTPLVTMALAPGLLLASTSAQGSAAPSPAGQEDAKRGPNGKWSKISSNTVSSFTTPGFVRGSDGVLHVFNTQKSGDQQDIRETEIRQDGKIGTSRIAVNNWDVINEYPKAVRQGGRIRLAFGGIRTDDINEYFSQGKVYSATSDSGHGSWAVPRETLTETNTAHGSYGTGAVTTASGEPVVAYVMNNELIWHVGTIPEGTPGTDSVFNMGAGSSLYKATLVRDGSKVYAAWYSANDTASKQGTFVKQILPTEGPTVKAPKSTVQYEGEVASVEPNNQIAMVRRTTGGVYLAYCVGYPDCSYVGLWKVGSSSKTVKKIPGSSDAGTIALAAAPSGRMWVAWEKNDRAYAVRTAKAGTRTGTTRVLKNPSGQAFVYAVHLDAGTGNADLVVNTGKALYHQQVRPGLSLSASPVKWRAGVKKTVKFRVTEAGSAVAGATVKAFGKKCKTKADGRCKITFGKLSARKGRAVASRFGYFQAVKALRVVRR